MIRGKRCRYVARSLLDLSGMGLNRSAVNVLWVLIEQLVVQGCWEIEWRCYVVALLTAYHNLPGTRLDPKYYFVG